MEIIFWDTKGKYIIKAKLKDEFGVEREWKTLNVITPRNKILYYKL